MSIKRDGYESVDLSSLGYNLNLRNPFEDEFIEEDLNKFVETYNRIGHFSPIFMVGSKTQCNQLIRAGIPKENIRY